MSSDKEIIMNAMFAAIVKGIGKGTAQVGVQIGHKLLMKQIRRSGRGMFKKNLDIPDKDVKPRKTLVTVQRHNAKKAGLHYDFRVRDRKRLLSFVFKKKPPRHWSEKPGTGPTKGFKTKVIRTADHRIGWDSFEGKIEAGAYGEGDVEIEYQSPGILWYRPGRLHVFSPYNDSPWSGHWTFVEITRKNFTAIREAAFPDVWIPRPKYSDVPPENIGEKIKDKNGNLIAERKVDGANFILRVNSPGLETDDIIEVRSGLEAPLLSPGEKIIRRLRTLGGKLGVYKVKDTNHEVSYKIADASEVDLKVDNDKVRALQEAFKEYADINLPKDSVPVTFSLISRRYSKAGFTIHREGNVSHLAFGVLPEKFVGKVFRVELWHPDGVSFLSGTLNSGWERALLAQKKHGFIRMMVFDYEGSSIDDIFIGSPLHYSDRRAFYEDLVRNLNIMRYNKNTLTTVSNKNGGFYSVPDKISGRFREIDKFYKKVTRSPLPLGEGLVIKDPDEAARIQRWLKMKKVNTFDLMISDIEEGNGKYKGAAGKVIAVDKTGTPVAKVGGGFTDEERFAMWENPNSYIGKVIEVKAQDLGKEALRAPRFVRWRDDKSPEDIDIVPVASHEAIIKNYLRGAGLSEKEIDDSYYAVKVATGWRPRR